MKYHSKQSLTINNATNNSSTATDMYYQALGLLYNILSHDSQAKMNIAQVRQLVLSEGIVDITQIIQKQQRIDMKKFNKIQELKHKSLNDGTKYIPAEEGSSSIDDMIDSLLEVIMSDWS